MKFSNSSRLGGMSDGGLELDCISPSSQLELHPDKLKLDPPPWSRQIVNKRKMFFVVLRFCRPFVPNFCRNDDLSSTMNWVSCLQTDSVLPDTWKNGHNREKFGYFLQIRWKALNLLINNQLNSSSNSTPHCGRNLTHLCGRHWLILILWFWSILFVFSECSTVDKFWYWYHFLNIWPFKYLIFFY